MPVQASRGPEPPLTDGGHPGKRGPENAKSICSYSGLNDDSDDPVEVGQTQSYGQEVKKGNEVPSDGAAPGFAYNPNNRPLK